MVCDCVERFRVTAEERRSKAGRMLEVDMPRRLDAFAAAMRLGAVQLVARQLLRAGIFRVSLDLNGSRDVSIDSALDAVRRVVTNRPGLGTISSGPIGPKLLGNQSMLILMTSYRNEFIIGKK